MTARWRGIRAEFRQLVGMLWDAAHPLTGVQLSTVRQITEQYVSDSAALAATTNEREQVAA